MAFSLVYIAITILLICLCFRGAMCVASLIILLQGACASVTIALVILFALPKGQVVGPNLPSVPLIVAAIVLLASVLSVSLAQKNKNEPSGHHNKVGIVLLVLGVVLWFMAFLSFLLFIFGGIDGGPNPQSAAITFSVFSFAGSSAFYFLTKYETIRLPNLYRWVAFYASYNMFTIIFICSLILLFAYPSTITTSHPFWASIISINFIPVSFLFTAINKSYVKKIIVSDVATVEKSDFDFKFE